MEHEYSWLQSAVNVLLEGLEEQALIEVSVHDIFWGYDDKFMHLVKEVLDKLHVHSKIITGKFGFYMGVSRCFGVFFFKPPSTYPPILP
jgi:hypothetical protein